MGDKWQTVIRFVLPRVLNLLEKKLAYKIALSQYEILDFDKQQMHKSIIGVGFTALRPLI